MGESMLQRLYYKITGKSWNIPDDDQEKIEFGIITLGNSGVGKSFLCNLMLGEERFTHEFSPCSVTSQTESVTMPFGKFQPIIFNVPGLIEADQERIETNKNEIKTAFETKPWSIVLFVFGTQQGRIRDEDVVAFKALHQAYTFNQDALLLVINGLPKERPARYDADAMFQLQRVLGSEVKITNKNCCFLSQIQKNKQDEQFLRECLLEKIVGLVPKEHNLTNEISLLIDEIRDAKTTIKQQLEEITSLRHQFEEEINNLKIQIENERQEHKTEDLIKEIAKLKAEVAHLKKSQCVIS